MRAPVLAAILALLASPAARAEEAPHGSLDFSRLTTQQSDFFWRRLRSLAIEEAVLSYCGQPDDFERQAKQGIRACVTAAALDKAQAYFSAEMKTALASLHERKASCRGKPEAKRGWLGVEIRPDARGVLVTAAMAGSPAAAADLKAGDVIASVNGHAIAGPKQLSAKIRALAPGATVALGLLRDGAGRQASVKLGGMAFDADGQAALDMPALMVSSRQDLHAIADAVTDMCARCKTSIWALFCR
ncbi:MAG TPA: PDZ domain-containing protein [Roseiarcus sp.]|nr:PDZ domain-containing protein [Roseiarcus sp.]